MRKIFKVVRRRREESAFGKVLHIIIGIVDIGSRRKYLVGPDEEGKLLPICKIN